MLLTVLQPKNKQQAGPALWDPALADNRLGRAQQCQDAAGLLTSQ